MTIQTIGGRGDWWMAHQKIGEKEYVEFGWSLDSAIEYLLKAMEKDGHYAVAKPFPFV